MTLARFFDRVYAAAGRHLSITRESLEQVLEGQVVGVRIFSKQTNDAWTADLLCNLMARLFPTVALRCDHDTGERLSQIMRGIQPNIEIVDGDDATTLWVDIGATNASDLPVVAVASAGWSVLVARSGDAASSAHPATPYAAAAAACLGMSALFRKVFIERDYTIEPFDVSLLTYRRSDTESRALATPDVELDTTALVGLGAVANGAIWVLSRHETLRGDLHLVDAEQIELSNLQRYVLAGDSDEGRQKTDLARASFANSTLSITSHAMSFERLPAELLEQIPTMLVSVDNVATRRAVQALLPRLVVNGWTSDTGLGASWHQFGRSGGCLSCLYQPTGIAPSQTELAAKSLGITPERAALLWVTDQKLSWDDLKKIEPHLGLRKNALREWHDRRIQEIYSEVVCGMVPVPLPGLERLEAVPLAHQSCLAGVLAAAELVKRLDPELARLAQEDPVIAWHDIRRGFPAHPTQPLASVPGCICADDDYLAVYTTKWHDG